MASSAGELVRKAQAEVLENNAADYYRVYHRYERRYWREIPSWLQEEEKGVGRVLDIGCSYGTLLVLSKLLFECECYGIDLFPYISRELMNKHNLRCSLATDIEVDPFPWEKSFDIIIMTEIIEHFRFRPEPTLVKIAKHLAPGGRIYLSTPNRNLWDARNNRAPMDSLNELPFFYPGHPQAWTALHDHTFQYDAKDIYAVAERSGLSVSRFSGDKNYEYNAILEPVEGWFA